MLTLEDLMDMVQEASYGAGSGMRVPGADMLAESGIPVAAREKLDSDTEVTVFMNGYVLYRCRRRRTVFPLDCCESYSYEFDSGYRDIPADFFMHNSWYLRLVLEGEDRIARNQYKNEHLLNLSYSGSVEEWMQGEKEGSDVLEELVEKEGIRELLSYMTERQRDAVERYYLKSEPQEEIAADLGISQQAVSKLIMKGLRRAKGEAGYED